MYSSIFGSPVIASPSKLIWREDGKGPKQSRENRFARPLNTPARRAESCFYTRIVEAIQSRGTLSWE
jgi:hypothetical protein